MSVRGAPWYAGIAATIASGIAGYYASGAGSGAPDIRSNEHRITQIEDQAAYHSRQDDRASCLAVMDSHNIWYAIAKNHGDPLPPPATC